MAITPNVLENLAKAVDLRIEALNTPTSPGQPEVSRSVPLRSCCVGARPSSNPLTGGGLIPPMPCRRQRLEQQRHVTEHRAPS